MHVTREFRQIHDEIRDKESLSSIYIEGQVAWWSSERMVDVGRVIPDWVSGPWLWHTHKSEHTSPKVQRRAFDDDSIHEPIH